MEKHFNKYRINTKNKILQTFIPKNNKGKESFLQAHNFYKNRNENFALLRKKKVTKIARITNLATE